MDVLFWVCLKMGDPQVTMGVNMFQYYFMV